MTAVEIFALFGTGYVVGLSLASGFIFQGIRKLYQATWSRWRETIWATLAMANIVLCALMSVLFIGLAVVGDQPDRPDFWPRAGLYTLGIAVGGGLVFFAVHLVNVGVRSYPANRA